jgi:hypothetical protein
VAARILLAAGAAIGHVVAQRASRGCRLHQAHRFEYIR